MKHMKWAALAVVLLMALWCVAVAEDMNTGDASLDNPRNTDGIGQDELLVVSFGTSFNDSRRLTIGAIEDEMEKAFPQCQVRRALTSQIILDHVRERDGEEMDNVHAALERAVRNGVRRLVVQPTHLMDGFEYHELVEELSAYADAFDRLEVGRPLLDTAQDMEAVARIITDATQEFLDGKTAVVFMGHGTEAASNHVYAQMQQVLRDQGAADRFVGTVEAEPSLEDILRMVKDGGYTRVVMRPLMVVAGDHAHNDMAGEEPDSWKSRFEAEGFNTVCVLEGLGELEAIRQLYVHHAEEALKKLK